MKKPVKWIASFDDPIEADKCMSDHAKRIKRLGVAHTYSVNVRTSDGQHHVYLFERDQ